MKNALIAAVVAAVVAAASGTAATIVVTSKQIKNGTIQTVDISPGAKRALKGNRGPQGAPGVAGAAGVAGQPGPPGIQTLTRVVASIEIPPETYDSITAQCPAGQKAVSGGMAFPGGGTEVWENQMKPIGGDGWSATGANYNETETYTLYAIAVCSPNVQVTGVG